MLLKGEKFQFLRQATERLKESNHVQNAYQEGNRTDHNTKGMRQDYMSADLTCGETIKKLWNLQKR